MPVALFLSDPQMDVFQAAIKSKTIEFKTLGRSTIQLTGDNWQAIRDAVTELHNKKFGIRTKTIEHMETCYYAEEILKKIYSLEPDLQNLPSANDNAKLVPVETPEEAPTTTTVETTPEEITAKTEAGEITPTESKNNGRDRNGN